MALSGLTRLLGISLLLVLIVCVTTMINPNFSDPENLSNVLRSTALLGILALGVAFVIVTGGIDLSIGSVVALSGVTLMLLLQINYVDSGQSLTVVDIDPDSKAVVFEQALPEIHDLDQLLIPNPADADDILLYIDATATAELGQANTIVVSSNVQRVPIGGKASLRYQSRLMHPIFAVLLTLLLGAGIGLFHGILIGYVKLQSFVVTLCGLMAYRGIARIMSGDESVNIGQHHEGLSYLAQGKPVNVPLPFLNWISQGNWSSTMVNEAGKTVEIGFWGWVPLPMPMLILLALAVLSAVFLHKTVGGRYLLAMGRNAEAARFSGINTKRMTALAYVLCSTLAALGGILYALYLKSAQPATDGTFYELYAIAAAVLGGCSLRGGIVSVAGVIIGATIIRTLYTMINFLGKSSEWQDLIIGVVLLLGVMIDEVGRLVINRVKTQRRKKKLASGAGSG